MSLKKLRIAALITFSIFAAVSCKDEEETTSYPSLEGNISIVGLEEFVDANGNRTLKLKPSGAVHPEDKEMGYCWKITPLMEKYDTTRFENGLDRAGKASDGSFEYQLKDSLGTYTVYCYAFASGYSSTYAIAYTTLVRNGENGSITNTGVYDNGAEVSEDVYYYVSLGDIDCITTNVYKNNHAAGTPFRRSSVMTEIFGVYYNYDDAKHACESVGEGEWRLPSEEDWIKMVKYLVKDNANAPEIKAYNNIYWDKDVNGTPTLASQLMADAYFNSEQMWTYWPEVGDITNRSGLAMIPTGYASLGITPAVKSAADYPNAKFEGLFDYSVFWTSSEVEGEEGMAYYRYIYGNQPHFMIGKGSKEAFGASVRCVRDSK